MNQAKNSAFKKPKIVFHNLYNAWRFAFACVKPHIVIQGDEAEFWIVTPAEAGRLMKAGYEPAPTVRI